MSDIRLSSFNKAVAGTLKHLNNAVTLEPKTSDGVHRSGMRKVVTNQSLDRYLKANKIGGKEKAALKQVFVTLAGRQSQGQSVTVVDISHLKSLAKTLKSFVKTHNKSPLSVISSDEQAKIKKNGKTASALLKAIDALESRKFSKLVTDREFAGKVDKVLENLLVKYNKGSGYLYGKELYWQLKQSNASNSMKDALWKSFRYLSRTMTSGGTNSTRICIDQRVECTRYLMRLFAGSSSTKRAIMEI